MTSEERAEQKKLVQAVFHTEPNFKQQEDEFGNLEKVDISKFNRQVVCGELGCLRVRYVKGQDMAQTKYCKPCTRKRRLAARAKRARERRARRDNLPNGSL